MKNGINKQCDMYISWPFLHLLSMQREPRNITRETIPVAICGWADGRERETEREKERDRKRERERERARARARARARERERVNCDVRGALCPMRISEQRRKRKRKSRVARCLETHI
jgi:hypothetical protein